MKKLFGFLALFISCLSYSQEKDGGPILDIERALGNSETFNNPLFAGDYPDPSILVDGDTYYIVHSSFEYYPGLTIWSSHNLKDWIPVQSPLTKYIGSVWAPDFVKYDGKYYIYFPAGTTNYVIWADSIKGKWSEPIDLHIGGIDPGHITDGKGRRYLYFSNGGYIQLTKDGLATKGEYKHVYDGWEIPREWSIECFCMEGPKLTKHDDYYYLTVAEGGTAGPATGHMVISARSKSPLGPWENSPYNPILRAKSSHENWCSIGHATPFADKNGDWWMVFHGYENGHYNMGRQTCLAPIEWTQDGWWKLPDGYAVEKSFDMNIKQYGVRIPQENSIRPKLFHFWKEYDISRFTEIGNKFIVNGKGTDVVSSSPLLLTPSNHSYECSVEVEIDGDAIAGLLLFYNEKAYSGILADKSDVLSNLRGWQFPTETNVHKRHVFLKLKNYEDVVDMYYSLDGKNWTKTTNSFDISGYHHNVLGEFLAVRIALVSIGEGSVTFKDFNYQPIE